MTLPAPSSTLARRDVRNGMLMMVAGMLIIPGIDAIAKSLAGQVSPGQIAASRFLFQTAFLLPFVVIGSRYLIPRGEIWVHAARGFLIALATLLFFSSLRVLPLADAISIFFVEPLILTVLAAIFLAEPIGWRRVTAILIGFCGALIIVRPSYQVFGAQALLPLGAALAFAIYLTLTRHLARAGDPVTMQFYAGVFGGLTMAIALTVGGVTAIPALVPSWPTLSQWALLALLGVIGTGAHMLVVHAFKRAPASILAPFQYLEIISATALGLLIFGDFPDATTWLGIAIIVGSGLYVFHREQQVEARTASEAAAKPRA
ncbi:MAG: DMT family transporter [Pseudomonadota bacterium]